MARLSRVLLGLALLAAMPACGPAAQEGGAAEGPSVKKLPRANRVAPKHDEEDNDDPALVSSDQPEDESTAAPVKKKPRPTPVATAKAKAPSPIHNPTPAPRPPPTRDER